MLNRVEQNLRELNSLSRNASESLLETGERTLSSANEEKQDETSKEVSISTGNDGDMVAREQYYEGYDRRLTENESIPFSREDTETTYERFSSGSPKHFTSSPSAQDTQNEFCDLSPEDTFNNSQMASPVYSDGSGLSVEVFRHRPTCQAQQTLRVAQPDVIDVTDSDDDSCNGWRDNRINQRREKRLPPKTQRKEESMVTDSVFEFGREASPNSFPKRSWLDPVEPIERPQYNSRGKVPRNSPNRTQTEKKVDSESSFDQISGTYEPRRRQRWVDSADIDFQESFGDNNRKHTLMDTEGLNGKRRAFLAW